MGMRQSDWEQQVERIRATFSGLLEQPTVDSSCVLCQRLASGPEHAASSRQRGECTPRSPTPRVAIVNRRRRAAALSFVAAGVPLASVAGLTSPAAASGACVDPNPSNYHTGAESPVAAFQIGASATIDFRQPILCFPTDGNRGATAWAMSWATGNGGYAQAGYYRLNNQGAEHFFSQDNECWPGCGPPTTVELPNGPSQAHTYKVVYDANIARLRMYYGTSLISTTSYDPFVTWSGLVQGQYFGETIDGGDDMIGTVGNVTKFRNIQVQNAVTGWSPPASLTRGNNHPHGQVWQWSNDSIDV